MQATKLRMTTS